MNVTKANSLLMEQLSDSANDFQNVVWPKVSGLPLVGGGSIRPVEAVAEKDFKDELDLLSGIDAWQIHHAPSTIRGIASRVQWGECYQSFSVRTRLPSGNETEFQKRQYAIQNKENGHLYPHLTIQAFLNTRGGSLLAAAAIKTVDLIEAAAILVENRTRLIQRPDFYGFIPNKDGTEFLYMRWAYLKHIARLREEDIFCAQI